MKKHTMFSSRLVTVIALASITSGCAVLNPSGGASDFSCPGMPQGVVCKSPMAVYNSTNDAVPTSEHDAPVIFNGDGSITDMGSAKSARAPEPTAPPINFAPAGGTYVSPVGGRAVQNPPTLDPGSRDPEQFLRDMDSAKQKAKTAVATPYLPVRSPATVMRIWIAPWIDKNDDLHLPSYLYTEVEPRKWSIGTVPNIGAAVVVPHRDTTVTAPNNGLSTIRQVPMGGAQPQAQQRAQAQAYDTVNDFNAGAINLNDR